MTSNPTQHLDALRHALSEQLRSLEAGDWATFTRASQEIDGLLVGFPEPSEDMPALLREEALAALKDCDATTDVALDAIRRRLNEHGSLRAQGKRPPDQGGQIIDRQG